MPATGISIQIPPTIEAVYSNLVQIAFKDDEMTLIFAHLMPAINQAKGKAIVTMSPQQAKRLYESLHRSLGEYESKFGEISAAPAETPDGTLQGYS